MSPPTSPRAVSAAVVIAIVLGLVFQLRIAMLNKTGWGVDFNQFYSAGQLAGTGRLYDWDALQKIEAQHGGATPTGRLPVVLYGHRILSHLPYRTAQFLWMTLNLAALLAFVFTWPGARRSFVAIAVSWSIPATLMILFGQDTPFWLLFFAAGLLLMEKKKPVGAGVAFSLCVCKFHLALGIPILLVAQRRWKTLIAGAVSVLALLACCFAVEGQQWPEQYLRMARLPAFSPTFDAMPTLAALAARFPWPAAAELIGAAAIVLLLWIGCRRITDIGTAGAAAAACGLLIAHHALFADTLLLLPLAVFAIQREGTSFWLKAWALLMLSPAPFLVATALHRPLLWQALIAPFVCAAVAVASLNRRASDDVRN